MWLRAWHGRLTRGGATAAVGLLAVTVLAGCVDDDKDQASSSGGYCDDLSAAKESITGLLDNRIGADAFADLLASMHTLRDEAPPAVHADWATFAGAVDSFDAAMREAGLTMDDMRDMGTGNMPGGMDMQTAMEAASALGAADVSTAESGIAAHGMKACGVDLNG